MVAFILISFLFNQETNWRTMLDQAYVSEVATIRLRDELASLSAPTPLEKAYLATAQLLMAEHTYFPWNKLKYFHLGSQLLDQAAIDDADNVEIRFLRFACQTNTPEFLGYNKHLSMDKEILISYLDHATDHDLSGRIKKVLLASKDISANEKMKLQER